MRNQYLLTLSVFEPDTFVAVLYLRSMITDRPLDDEIDYEKIDELSRTGKTLSEKQDEDDMKWMQFIAAKAAQRVVRSLGIVIA